MKPSLIYYEFEFVNRKEDPNEVSYFHLLQLSDNEKYFDVDLPNADSDYYLVRNFDATKRTIEMLKVDTVSNDLDTATLPLDIGESWKTYSVDENALYSGWGINGCSVPYFEESTFMKEKVNVDYEDDDHFFAVCGIYDGKIVFINEVLNP